MKKIRHVNRVPKQRGRLRMVYARGGECGDGDLAFVWGEGVPRYDGRLLYSLLAAKRCDINGSMQPSVVERLEMAGYDITTIEFSIRKKADA